MVLEINTTKPPALAPLNECIHFQKSLLSTSSSKFDNCVWLKYVDLVALAEPR